MIEFICNREQTLKDFTDNTYAQASFAWQYLLKNKEIKVNGKKVGENVQLHIGDNVQYYLTKKQAEKQAFFTVYEDENILIIDKESGVNSEAVFNGLNEKGRGRYAFIHRLDRNTRGLMVFAKTEVAERELLLAFKERCVEKRYHTLCFGKMPGTNEVLTAYLQKDEKNARVRIFDSEKKGTEPIVTEYKVLETHNDTQKLEVTLHTGKTHQIRAHLAHLGCPIVGDMKYGNEAKNREYKTSRQVLVSKYLRFSCNGMLAYLQGKIFVSKFEV